MVFCVMYYLININKDFELYLIFIEIVKINRFCGLGWKEIWLLIWILIIIRYIECSCYFFY